MRTVSVQMRINHFIEVGWFLRCWDSQRCRSSREITSALNFYLLDFIAGNVHSHTNSVPNKKNFLAESALNFRNAHGLRSIKYYSVALVESLRMNKLDSKAVWRSKQSTKYCLTSWYPWSPMRCLTVFYVRSGLRFGRLLVSASRRFGTVNEHRLPQRKCSSQKIIFFIWSFLKVIYVLTWFLSKRFAHSILFLKDSIYRPFLGLDHFLNF